MLEKEISKLGLSEKEAKVYLASLELGPSPVQAISLKAKVNRATTYVVIDSLMEMGLMSTYDEGKKTYFAAEQPERFLDYLKSREAEAREKTRILEEKMPELKSLFAFKDKPIVKYYEGIEGLRSVQNDIAESLKSGDDILIFLPYDDFFNSGLIPKFRDNVKHRVAKKINAKIIYTSRKGRQYDYEKDGRKNLTECLYIDYKDYPTRGGMNIYGDKIFMIDYLGKTGGIVVENRVLANMMKSLFLLCWRAYIKNNFK
ncbi:MAG: TrmB protein [Patescibacteria group bacterium]|nr:TrmB protein [Patescibacteria group bacterium]